MTAITTFPTIKNVVRYGEKRFENYVAATTILAGQAVALGATQYNSTADWTVYPSTHAAGEIIIGVAVTAASQGQQIAVAGMGEAVQVANTDSATAIAAGTWVETSSNSVGGCVQVAPGVNGVAGGTGTSCTHILGQCVATIAANGTGYVRVQPCVIQQNTTTD